MNTLDVVLVVFGIVTVAVLIGLAIEWLSELPARRRMRARARAQIAHPPSTLYDDTRDATSEMLYSTPDPETLETRAPWLHIQFDPDEYELDPDVFEPRDDEPPSGRR